MADYKIMYEHLFRSVTKAIGILQLAQQETEELYISSKPADLHLIDPNDRSLIRQKNETNTTDA